MLTSEPLLRNRSIASFILYGLTILTVGVAAALQWAIAQAFGPLPTYVMFYPAMMLSALLGGVGPGLLATGLGALVADWMFLSPLGSLGVDLRSDVVGLFLFCFNGVFISLIVGRLRVARTEAEIVRQSEERFRALADNIAQLAWMADGKGLAFWYNRRWYDYTGATVNEMEGSGWQKLHHPDHVQRVAEKMRYCLQHGEIWEDTIPLRGKDGQYRWFFSTAIPILDKAGKVWRWFGTHTDVTGLREAEEALRRANERVAGILGSITDLYISYDREWRFTDLNPQAEYVFGRKREEVIGKVLWEVFPQNTQQEIYRRYQGAMASQIPVHFETFSTIAGRWFEVHAYPSEEGLSTYFRDVTERKRAEEALADRTVQLQRMNRELVALNAELENFTNLTSHDLQEPLRTLTAFSDLLRKDLGQSLPERAAQDLGFITDAAKRMQTLIRDLLALSRAGRVAKKREKVSLSECVDQALEALAMRVNETGAEISRDKLPDVWGDSILLTQLYQNLIGNALKFSGDQRPIIQLTFEEREGEQIFGVKDNGIGIEPKYAQQIFQPFKRLHGPAEYEGSGIGLAICRKIVERHGGKIWVESESGKGAHFRFTILHRMRER